MHAASTYSVHLLYQRSPLFEYEIQVLRLGDAVIVGMPGEPFDCVFIKNVLIYFDAESKRKVVDVVVAALAKGGRLVVGPTEGIHNMLDGLEKVKTWLYRKGG